jgi:hypothetical protein
MMHFSGDLQVLEMYVRLTLACMMFKTLPFLLLVAGSAWAQLEVVATGLQAPQKVIVTPAGNLLVSETSVEPNSGRVSKVSRDGVRQTLLEGLPSGLEVAGGGSGPTAMALRERTLYVAIGGGDVERRGEAPGTSIHNPMGASSALFASILSIQLDRDVDAINGPFRFTSAHQQVLRDGGEVRIEDGSGSSALVNVLTRLPISEPDPNTIYRFSNPWGLALSADGTILYVADASMNALVRVNTGTGRWQRIMRFPPLPNQSPVGPPVRDAVPTSVRIYGDQVLMSFLTGFPFNPGSARVLAVNPAERTVEPFIFGLSSAVDVLWRPTNGPRPQFFTLEFSQNQSAQPPGPGRLLRYDTPAPQVVAADLRAPVSMALDASSNTLYVLELTGRLLRLRLD